MTASDGTRSRSIQMDVEVMRGVLQDILKKMESLDSRLVAIENNSQTKGSQEATTEEEGETIEKLVRRSVWSEERVTRQTKVGFPSFDGTRIQEWLFRSERFFELDETPSNLKVSIACVYLSGLAMEWHYAFINNRKLRGPISWEEYSAGMLTRFGSNDVTQPIALLKRLREEHSFFDYIDNFVSLVSKVDLPDEDQVTLFVEGLKEDNQKLLKVLGPKTLQQAISFAKTLISEEDHYSSKSRGGEYRRTVAKHCVSSGGRQTTSPGHDKAIGVGSIVNRSNGQERGSSATTCKNLPYQPPHKRLSPTEIKENRLKELCFLCDEQFTLEHKCAIRRLYSQLFEHEEEKDVIGNNVIPEVDEETIPAHSLHALHGVDVTFYNRTIKLEGHYEKKKSNAFINSGIPHNFVDVAIAKQVGCSSQIIPAQKEMVVNKKILTCDAKIRGFIWEKWGKNLEYFILLMSLKNERLIKLEVVPYGGVKVLKSEMEWLGNGMVLMVLQNDRDSQVEDIKEDFALIPTEVQQLLNGFSIIFQEPKSLQPYRRNDHCRPLEDGVKDLRLRPYIYFSSPKDVIENLVTAMLRLLRFHLHVTHHMMIQFANKGMIDRAFQKGDWAYAKLHPYEQRAGANRENWKMSLLYYGPFHIVYRIGQMTYKLDLPHQFKEEKEAIHPLFTSYMTMVRRGNKVATQGLIQWSDKDITLAIREFLYDLQLFDGDPYSNCGYYCTETPENVDFYGVHYITKDGYVMSCGEIENDELVVQDLQEELSQLAIAEIADSVDAMSEQLQAFPEAGNGNYVGGYSSGQEEAEDISHSSSCSSPGGEVYCPEEWPCAWKIPHDCEYDEEVGKRLNWMICVPHTPRTNDEISSVDEATLDHQRLLERRQLYGLVEHEGDGNCQFRALSDQIYRTPEHHEFIIQQIMKQLKSCRDVYAENVPMAYDEYLEKMSKTGEWGDHMTLQVAADLHGVRISVIISFKDTRSIEILPKDQRSKRVIFLSFWDEVHRNFTLGGKGDVREEDLMRGIRDLTTSGLEE